MKISLKRWVKILLLIITLPFLLVGGIYYILLYNVKDVMKYAIEKKTNGGYTFHSEAIRISLLDRTISIDSLTLERKDTTNIDFYYNVNIPKARLSIDSWRELLINKRVFIDSLLIENPDIVIHDYKVHKKTQHQTSFRTSMILEGLQKTLDHLHAKAFTIKKASLTIFKRNSPYPLVISDLSVSVRNFLKIDNNDKRLFASDNIELALGRQRWVLSDGKNNLSFVGFRFSSSTQLFEIDSVHFQKPATPEQGEVSLKADKFFFNSSHIPAIYQKGELSLDTLICVRPVLSLPLTNKKSETKTDTSVHSDLKSLFKTINVQYTEIKDGEIVLAGQAKSAKAGTQKANLNIYNLTIIPHKQQLTLDSIKLNLNNIAFYSKDSLFKINVERFTMKDDDVLLKNVHYSPASPKMAGKGMAFTASALHLKHINLNDLFQKRLVAEDAYLYEPKITLIATRKVYSKPTVTATNDSIVIKKTDIYQTLHSFGELLQVNRFHIVNGSGDYKVVGGDKQITANLKQVNATILVNELLASDSLIKIKRAIPNLRIREMDVVANGYRILLSHYRIDGKNQLNWIDKVKVDLANGTSLVANKIYWEAFSWDMLQHTKVIQIDQVRVHDLVVDAKLKNKTAITHTSTAHKPQPRSLPGLRIGQLFVEQLDLKAVLPNEVMAGFTGQRIEITKLTTDPKYFQWEQLLGNLNNLYYRKSGGKQVDVAQVALHSHELTTLTNTHYRDNTAGNVMDVTVPKMQIKGPFPSSDFSNINLSQVQIERPELTMVREGKQQSSVGVPAKAFSIPLNLVLDELDINQARVNITTKKGQDSIKIQTIVNVDAKSLHAKKHENATFASIKVSPADIKLNIPKLDITAQSANVQLTNGKLVATKDGKPSLTTHLLANLTVNDLHPALKSKKNATPPELSAKTISGSIDMPNFNWTAGKKLIWPTFVAYSNLAITGLSFKSVTTSVKAKKVSWEHTNERLQLDNFQIIPVITKEEFMTPPHLQSDYITVRGGMLQLNGIKAARWYNDSTLDVNHIVVSNIITDVSRDKRLPDPAVLPRKLMPTQLISRIKVPFHVDSVSVVNSQVNYQETSKKTQRVATIPLREINGTLKNITNIPGKSTDSLKLVVNTKLLGLHINRLNYRESYKDSLSGFRIQLKTSDMHMSELSPITKPMASASLRKGYLQPMTAQITGNQYASVGRIQFYYKDLKLRLLDHRDSTRNSFMLRLKNFAASKILRKKNMKEGRIFYDRDYRKFIFSYWIKSITSGVMTSVGVKGNKKYHANYLKLSKQHTLPAEE